MSGTASFQARDHGNGCLEIIGIFPGMTPSHPAVAALMPLARRFRHLIFTLETGASFTPEVLPLLLQVSATTRLKIACREPSPLPLQKAGLSVFGSPEEALRRARGEDLAQAILLKMETVPQLNSKAYEILQKSAAPATTFADLDRWIAGEAALAAQILKTANSAFFMRRSRLETLGAALAYLGLEGIRQILVFHVFKGLSGYFGAQREVIRHGRCCAHLAAWLAGQGKADRPTVGKVRLAGLLHDVGSMALAFYQPQEYEEVRRLVRQDQKRTYEAERQVFGIEHQELGRQLAEKWSFPEYLARAIGDHHQLQDPAWDVLTGPVFCANGFLNQTVEKIPCTPYYQKLRQFFGTLDEKTTIQDLQTCLREELDRFLAAEGTEPD